ncbi:membrane protein [Bordetella ansorpii]|uniref:Membrane protein n=1 Tax=Bordetella ansorpii TaxID=288768 RepID=A0A157SAD2_9BORD|nr:hypothetical protein [Bordetella ansorpii]SAI67329.1 membrane protein [Bordetella ansorpii]
MTDASSAPSHLEHAALLNEIGPLPLSGQAWPDWVRILTWTVLAVVGVQAISAAIRMPQEHANWIMAGFVTLCFLALGFVSLYMQTSVTTIDETGLHQSWIRPRDIAWQDIHFARFVPLLFSKRLVVFPHRGRPLVFQGGTRELQTAFEKISTLYRGHASS